MIDLPVPDVLAAARAAGIVRVVTVATDLESARWSAHCADQHAAVYAAVAIHPNDTEAATGPSRLPRDPRAPHVSATQPPLPSSPPLTAALGASAPPPAAAPSPSTGPPPTAAPSPSTGPPPTAAEVLAEIEA